MLWVTSTLNAEDWSVIQQLIYEYMKIFKKAWKTSLIYDGGGKTRQWSVTRYLFIVFSEVY